MTGLTAGLVLAFVTYMYVSILPSRTLAAPPIGGVLYDHFGFRAPFIFGIIFTAFDFVGRLLVIERKDALKWGHDPWDTQSSVSTIVEGMF